MDKKFSFFIIDDNRTFIHALTEVLASEGHTVQSGSVGRDTLSAIVASRPSCIIVDAADSGRDDHAIIRHLRGMHTLNDTKIAVLWTEQSEQLCRDVFAAGAEACIPKHGGPQAIARDLKQVIGGRIKFTFWGVHGTLTVPGRKTVRYGGNTPCVSVRLPGDGLFVFDAGSGIREFSNYLIAQSHQITQGTILISHPHWDHIHGLPFFVPLYPRGNSFDIYGPPNGSMSLRKLIAGQMDGVYFPINMKEFGAQVSFFNLGEEQITIGPATIQTMFLNHPGECLGYRLDYKGKSFCYVTDQELYPASSSLYDEDYVRRLETFVADADVLITDTTYRDEEYEGKIGWGHSSVQQAVEMADRAGIKKLYLFHHDLDQTDDDIDAKLEMAQTILEERGSSTLCIAPKEGESFTA